MSDFDIQRSFEEAARRLGRRPTKPSRRPRSDRGRIRLSRAAEEALAGLVGGQERPRMSDLLRQLEEACSRADSKMPSRATVYKYLATTRTPERQVRCLPSEVQRALYNFDLDSSVPEAQIAFYCFNYGELGALSYAAGLPWLAIYQARRTPGWRRKSHGLVEAVARVRRI